MAAMRPRKKEITKRASHIHIGPRRGDFAQLMAVRQPSACFRRRARIFDFTGWRNSRMCSWNEGLPHSAHCKNMEVGPYSVESRERVTIVLRATACCAPVMVGKRSRGAWRSDSPQNHHGRRQCTFPRASLDGRRLVARIFFGCLCQQRERRNRHVETSSHVRRIRLLTLATPPCLEVNHALRIVVRHTCVEQASTHESESRHRMHMHASRQPYMCASTRSNGIIGFQLVCVLRYPLRAKVVKIRAAQIVLCGLRLRMSAGIFAMVTRCQMCL